MIVLTKGGKLGDFAKENAIPSYIFDGGLNPSGVPRLGLGYSILGLMGLLSKVKVMDFDSEKIVSAITRTEEILPKIENDAQEFAEK